MIDYNYKCELLLLDSVVNHS